MIIVSDCLVGHNCRYDGSSETVERLKGMVENSNAIPVCPEQLGGLQTPRPTHEIIGGAGEDVLDGKARVVNSKGGDVTENFIKGARKVLVIAKDNNITKAVLKSRSPSCGCGKIYDGTFTGKLREGDGVTTALLKRNGIEVKTEDGE